MINYKTITQGIETVLNANLTGYIITRNAERNEDPDVAARGNGWIGIYRGPVNYRSYSIGATPWLVEVNPRVEIQVASMKAGRRRGQTSRCREGCP